MTRPVSQKVAVSVVYVAAMFITVMDSTIVNVALPTIGRTFHVPATSVASVSIYYLVSLAVFISASGWLGDRFGGKRVLLAAIAVFTAASALCGLAGSLTQAAAFATISPQATGRASTMFSVARQLGSATGVAVLTTAVVSVGATTSRAGHTVPNLTAYHVAFLVAAGIAVAAAMVALTIHDADAATTIAVRGGRGPRTQADPPSICRRRPKTKYESDPTPAELTSTAMATHIHFEPRIWLAGRLLRSMSTAVLRPASAVAAAMSNLRLRSLSSLHRLAMTPPRASATPDGLNLTRKKT
jgi:MFS family permease